MVPRAGAPAVPQVVWSGAGTRGLEAGGVLCLTEGDTEAPGEVAHGVGGVQGQPGAETLRVCGGGMQRRKVGRACL